MEPFELCCCVVCVSLFNMFKVQRKTNKKNCHFRPSYSITTFSLLQKYPPTYCVIVCWQLYGRRAAWEDPAAWVINSYPWSATPTAADWPPLLQLRPEDVGFDGYSAPREGARKEPAQSDSDADPLVSDSHKDAAC